MILAADRTARSQLLPRFGIVAAIDLIGLLITQAFASDPEVQIKVSLLTMQCNLIYAAVLVLKTRELTHSHVALHRVDRVLCRYAGLWTFGILVLLYVLGTVIGEAGGDRLLNACIESAIGLRFLHILMEIGLVLSLACLFARAPEGHVRPIWIWKLVNIPLGSIFLFLLVWIPVYPLVGGP